MVRRMVRALVKNYLKGEEWLNGKKFIILDEGSIRKKDETGFDRDILDILVSIDAKEYIWTMNHTSQRNFTKQYGMETSDWVGKKGFLEIRNEKVRGKDKLVIYGYPDHKQASKLSKKKLTNEEAEELTKSPSI